MQHESSVLMGQDLKTPPGSILDLCSHSGLLTKVLQETIGGETVDGQQRKWWMVEQSGMSKPVLTGPSPS